MDILYFLKLSTFSISLIWLTAILVALMKNKKVGTKWIKYGILAVAALYIATGLYSTLATYDLWSKDPVSKYLLPPYQSAYFYQYSLYRFWLPYLFNLAAAIIWLVFLFALKNYSQNRFLDGFDVQLGFFTAFVLDWHNFLVYSTLAFTIPLVFQAIRIIVFKKNELVPITYGLLLSALIILMSGNLILDKLSFLKIS